MKLLLNAIKIIKDCCTRREEFKESNYKQLLDLLPFGESYEEINEKNLQNLNNDISLTNIKLKLFDKTNNRKNILNDHIINKLDNSNKDEDYENINFSKNEVEDVEYKKKKVYNEVTQKHVLQDRNKDNNNYPIQIIKDDIAKKLKEIRVSNNIYCAHGKLSNSKSVEKKFKLKKIEIIPNFEKEENIMNSFSVVCMKGNQNEYNELKNNNDDVYFNNYEQFFFIQAYDLKIASIISGTGKNSVSVCDNIVFYLLKTILKNLKNFYENKRNIWLSDQIEYILLSSINDTNNYIKINMQESFNSGCSLCVCAYSKTHELLTILNIGNIDTILVKNIEEKKKDANNSYNSNTLYETILITKKHDILNKEEKERILSYGCVINNDTENKIKNTWKNKDYLNKFNEKNDLKSLNITKAIGLFNFNKYGLSNTPDIIDVKLNIHTSGFLVLVSHTISQVYNSHNLVKFLFNKSNNDSLFESSKKLIHNVHSVYLSTENNKVKDMTIVIVPLTD